MERYFFADGKKNAKIIPRLTRVKDAQNWLSMQPNPLRWYENVLYNPGFGEVNEDNKLHGRGIHIFQRDCITIGYFERNFRGTGHYIYIVLDGRFWVGECYMREGRRWDRGTYYKKNGKEE